MSDPVARPRPRESTGGADPAVEARTLAHAATIASLSTVAIEPAGYPFGSVVRYSLLDNGNPVLLISTLAEHTRNLAGDPRASLLICDPEPEGDVLDAGRLTLLGTARQVDGAERDAAKASYLARVPAAEMYADFADFSFWVLDVEAIRWVGGFGRMGWSDIAAYRAAVPQTR